MSLVLFATSSFMAMASRFARGAPEAIGEKPAGTLAALCCGI